MPRQTKAAKALAYIADHRVVVTSANSHGIRLLVYGTGREPYRVAYGRLTNGQVVAECTCEGADYHPVHPQCCHVEICKLLFRPERGVPVD